MSRRGLPQQRRHIADHSGAREPPPPRILLSEGPSLGTAPLLSGDTSPTICPRERRCPVPLSQMECCKCHGKFPVRRPRRHLRKKNHVKTMWCPWCKSVTPHRERF